MTSDDPASSDVDEWETAEPVPLPLPATVLWSPAAPLPGDVRRDAAPIAAPMAVPIAVPVLPRDVTSASSAAAAPPPRLVLRRDDGAAAPARPADRAPVPAVPPPVAPSPAVGGSALAYEARQTAYEAARRRIFAANAACEPSPSTAPPGRGRSRRAPQEPGTRRRRPPSP
ncbi:hypothetical protein CXG81DRAFT_27654 [Caulochytrium protostelioides]|uniref:SUZ domain-containing protein n=1 Tax=Caulochytrium protostelioides TaxID=1555241 RepID=A0A4P9X3K2_9FUNG|nr:hypothetical protein CXG81DRAFT_27654 [Caulochytrium protostelioides]|eukprot:RKO99606.1 hypothetical protein CXG81DRAFT_27654 [Caulochytrium protostelioides]